MLTREEALSLVKRNVKKKNIVYHMIAVEAIMRRLARYLEQDEDLWGLTGLLHDVDYEKIGDVWEKHGILAGEILKGKVSEEVIRAIKAHNFERTGVTPDSRMEKALICCDAISGLLVACALVMPSKKLAEVKVKTLKKKFKDKDFARGASRERVLFCEKVGVPKEKFFEIALEGLKEHSEEIGL
jgi:putative nucleotidyltransferase with HDIG domain